MKKTYKLEGLDCPNCAAKLEAQIQKLAGVQAAAINFFSMKLILEAEDPAALLPQCSELAKKFNTTILAK